MEEKALADIVILLREVQWLYDFPVTQILARAVLMQIPTEWREVFEGISLEALNGIPQFKAQEQWSPSLRKFLEQCRALSLCQLVSYNSCKLETYAPPKPQDLKLPHALCKGLSAKKKHEVLALVNLAKQVAVNTCCNHVLDIGCGMGYVDTLIHHELNIPVLGAESDETLVKNASTRQAGLAGLCKAVRFFHWTLYDDKSTYDKAQDVLHGLLNCDLSCSCYRALEGDGFVNDSHSQNSTHHSQNSAHHSQNSAHHSQNCDSYKDGKPTADRSSSSNVMLLGLHSCADLSPVMMKMFGNCPQISSLVLLSCCYHKMKLRKGEEHGKLSDLTLDDFANFPMSDMLKRIMKVNNFAVSVYGFRLAAQESGSRWSKQTKEDHQNHEKNVAYRALLEMFCIKEGYTLRKRRRRCARKSKFCNFDEYVKTAIENYQFVPVMQEVNIPLDPSLMSEEENLVTGIERDLTTSSWERGDIADPLTVNENLIAEAEEVIHISPDYIKAHLDMLYKTYEHLFSLIEPFTGLQLALQPVLEALVLIDRVVYLKECNFHQVWLERVFDERLSPRSVALIAIRN